MLDSLHRRRRGVPLSVFLCQLTGGRVPGPPPPPPPDLDAVRGELIVRALQEHESPDYAEQAGAVTRDLLERLGDADVEAVFASLDEETHDAWNQSLPWVRDHLKLILAAHHDVRPVLRKTGLRSDVPPDDVHAMGRGPMAAGGDFWLADILAGATIAAGFEFPDGARVLDFGCSSGRHLRVLQAWRPAVDWYGCDPNEQAIAWARDHLPGAEYFVSPQEPPLAMQPGSLDAVIAVSVWSHFGAGAAERWLAEMHRLIRPGGLLVFTTQGVGSLAHYLRSDGIDPPYAARAVEALLARGHFFVEAFGADGDWGVENDEWGMGYMTLDWLASRTLPQWSVDRFEPVRVDRNQDLVVLRRAAE